MVLDQPFQKRLLMHTECFECLERWGRGGSLVGLGVLPGGVPRSTIVADPVKFPSGFRGFAGANFIANAISQSFSHVPHARSCARRQCPLGVPQIWLLGYRGDRAMVLQKYFASTRALRVPVNKHPYWQIVLQVSKDVRK